MDKSNKDQADEKFLTTDQGVKITDNQNSLKAGERGPVLMEDFVFRQKITSFDHERIPERVVHARGSGAHGYFQVYASMSEYTKAGFLQDPNVKTPVFVRFSTVAGSRGSTDTARDVRGFAVKFYTQEGNYDLVGNNMPVFFIQDAIKFPDLVHAAKPEPDHEMPQASTAHSSFWDFISLTPESMHVIMWAMSDRGIPKSYSNIEGFGVHTFRLINDQDKSRFVKFHWKPVLGLQSLAWDEAQIISGKDPDFHRRQLWESIEQGNFPEYELGIQIIEEDQLDKFEFDILDPTKILPEEEFPVKIIGKMTLNRNPDNFFAETEQVAFHTANLVPGIDSSNDPLLQGRHFSYLDTQLIRLGGPNFTELPINRPHVEVDNNEQDGYMRYTVRKNRVNYEPNSLSAPQPKEATPKQGGFASYLEKMEGFKIRAKSPSFLDHYSQARMFWNSQTDAEKNHIVKAFHFELGKVEYPHIREKMLEHLANIDKVLAKRVADPLGLKAPSINDIGYPKISDALSIEKNLKPGIKGKSVAILIADGFNYNEFDKLKSDVEKEGGNVKVIAPLLAKVKSAEGKEVTPDMSIIIASSVIFEGTFVPGGKASVDTMSKKEDFLNFVKETYKHCKALGASSEGMELLQKAQINALKVSTDKTLSDAGVVTVKDNGDINNFNAQFIKALEKRHWVREDMDEKIKFDA